MKAQGAKKVASLGYGISPSSSEAAKSFNKYTVPSQGLDAVYTNTTVDFGSTDVSPLVLGIKNAGADAAFYAMNGNTNLAIAQGLKQNGVNMKAQLMATGYGQDLLDQPIANQLGPSVIFTQGWAPVEAKTTATKQFQADLKKYANSTGVPDFGIYTGYIDCDLAILGLKQQGKNLDQSTFADDLRKLGHVNPAGLNCQDLDISAANYGKSPSTICEWAVIVKNDKFVVLKPKGGNKPYWEREADRRIGHGERHHDDERAVVRTLGGRGRGQAGWPIRMALSREPPMMSACCSNGRSATIVE